MTTAATVSEAQTLEPVIEDDAPEFAIRVETFPVRLAKSVEVDLPVVHRTKGGQFVVVSNRVAMAGTPGTKPSRHPYFVVHVASGLRSPIPPSVHKHNLATARQLANYFELSRFFDATTGRPAVSADTIVTAVREWKP